MKFKENLGNLYYILPYISVIENKLELILSMFFGNSKYKFKIQNQVIEIHKDRFSTLRDLLGCLTFAQSYSINKSKILKISFDKNNTFEIPLTQLTIENINLVELLYIGTKFGANFITEPINTNDLREQTFKISLQNKRKIITTSDGISFFIDSIHPGNTIYETFIKKLHHINSKINWEDKIVVDVGAECGDTPLYFASLGAKVFAFEALRKHYDFMLDNIKLNPELSERIVPINAAIGSDGKVDFFVSEDYDDLGSTGASFLYNNQNENFIKKSVNGFKLNSARKKFKIEHIDLLKMDCKGCEFLLDNDDLKSIDRIKIEYSAHGMKNKLDNLIELLIQNNFHYMIFRHNSTSRKPNSDAASIFATRIENNHV